MYPSTRGPRRRTQALSLTTLLSSLASACDPPRPARDAAADDTAQGTTLDASEASVDASLDTSETALDASEASVAPDGLPSRDEATATEAGDARSADAPPETATLTCTTPGLRPCGERCVDLASDPSHCGACGQLCRAGANATAECIAGECDRACMRGFGDCDGDATNGCEAALDTNEHCGSCATRCTGTTICITGTCREAETAPAPRMRAPTSGSRLGTRRPALSWVLPSGVTGAEVQVCRDRACSAPMVVSTAGFDGSSGRLAEPLARGGYFWRVRARVAGRGVGAWSAPWWMKITGRETSSTQSFGTVSDFNGDGYADLLLSNRAVGNPGELRVYLGRREGLETVAAWRRTGPDGAGTGVGGALAAGDLDGDGFVDVIAGATDGERLGGRVYLFLGSTAGPRDAPAWTLSGGSLLTSLGDKISTGGDFDGDGYGDLIATAGAAGGRYFYGAVALYTGRAMGNPSAPALVLRHGEDRTDRRFGLDAVIAGDVNGDGYADVAAAAADRSDEPGHVMIFLGSPSGLQSIPALTLTAPGGGTNGDGFGKYLASAGDVNGDGYADLLVGGEWQNEQRGGAWLFAGSSSGLLAAPVWSQTGTSGGSRVGHSVAAGGDVDGDGFDDFVVSSGSEYTGTARVYFGSASGVRGASVLLTYADGSPLDHVDQVALVGDTNGDGFDEVAVGAPALETDTGAAYLFLGRADGVSPTPSWQQRGERSGDNFGRRISR